MNVMIELCDLFSSLNHPIGEDEDEMRQDFEMNENGIQKYVYLDG